MIYTCRTAVDKSDKTKSSTSWDYRPKTIYRGLGLRMTKGVFSWMELALERYQQLNPHDKTGASFRKPLKRVNATQVLSWLQTWHFYRCKSYEQHWSLISSIHRAYRLAQPSLQVETSVDSKYLCRLGCVDMVWSLTLEYTSTWSAKLWRGLSRDLSNPTSTHGTVVFWSFKSVVIFATARTLEYLGASKTYAETETDGDVAATLATIHLRIQILSVTVQIHARRSRSDDYRLPQSVSICHISVWAIFSCFAHWEVGRRSKRPLRKTNHWQTNDLPKVDKMHCIFCGDHEGHLTMESTCASFIWFNWHKVGR